MTTISQRQRPKCVCGKRAFFYGPCPAFPITRFDEKFCACKKCGLRGASADTDKEAKSNFQALAEALRKGLRSWQILPSAAR